MFASVPVRFKNNFQLHLLKSLQCPWNFFVRWTRTLVTMKIRCQRYFNCGIALQPFFMIFVYSLLNHLNTFLIINVTFVSKCRAGQKHLMGPHQKTTGICHNVHGTKQMDGWMRELNVTFAKSGVKGPTSQNNFLKIILDVLFRNG